MRIRALEDRLGTSIVKRGNRFQGLTPEGEKALDHAKRILAQVQTMEQELSTSPGVVAGSLIIGMIPDDQRLCCEGGQGFERASSAYPHPAWKRRHRSRSSKA